jgi:hypothetical protein
MEKVLTFPSCILFSVVAPLDLEELDGFTPRDTILLIQDFDWMLDSGYDKPALSAVTLGNTTCMGAF